MKKEATTLIVAAVVSAVMSLILSGLFLSTPADRAQRVETVETITTTFEKPPEAYFNSNAVNPAQNIQVGTDPNSKPFEDR